MKTKHTPGPWKMSEKLDYSIVDASEFLIATYAVSKDSEPQDLANARLIAAAPEMLELLEKLLKEQLEQGEQGDAENITLIYNVVRKAKGE